MNTFEEILKQTITPDANGVVPFGDAKEPLRTSQLEALVNIDDARANGQNIGYIKKPGGSGKTRIAVVLAYINHLLEQSSLFVVPSQQSILDFSRKTRKLCSDLDVGTIYQIEKRIGRLTFITYASLLRCLLGDAAEQEAGAFEQHETAEEDAIASKQNLVPMKEIFTLNPQEFTMVFWDEAHKYLTANAQKLIAQFPHAFNLGMTATDQYYPGKAVANVFGKKIFELSLRKAIERQDICDFRNILITTNVHTGLELNSPDQEESPDVIRAIDIPNRNKIFADFYRNARITVGEKTYTIVGEPTITFGGSIAHVHDLAKTYNDALMPLLRDDEEFRSLLQSKGINPDTVEQIAAPIHTGGNEKHAGMDLHEREALVKKYDERKILILTATTVLQQSFDHPPTSVVIDTIPRQSYVGVGQSGMRALRFLPGKMAFIVNTEDADHDSLTFQDFELDQGREQGVAVEIAKTKRGLNENTPERPAPDMSQYHVSYGYSLVDLAERRRRQTDPFYGDDRSFRHFTALGRQTVNELIVEIGTGKPEAIGTLLQTLRPWFPRAFAKAKRNILPKKTDPQLMWNMCLDAYLETVEKVQGGALHGWSRFCVAFDNRLMTKCRQAASGMSPYGLLRAANLHGVVKNVYRTPVSADEERDRAMINEPPTVRLHQTLPARDDDGLSENEYGDLQAKVQEVLRELPKELRDTVNLKYGFLDGITDRTLEEVGQKLGGLEKETVRQRLIKASKMLRSPILASLLEPFAFPEREFAPRPKEVMLELSKENEWEEEEIAPAINQEALNNRILWDMEEDIVEEKRKINTTFSWVAAHYSDPTVTIASILQISEADVRALSDVEWTRIHELHEALRPEKLEKIFANMHHLQRTFYFLKRSSIKKIETAIRTLAALLKEFQERGGVLGV